MLFFHQQLRQGSRLVLANASSPQGSPLCLWASRLYAVKFSWMRQVSKCRTCRKHSWEEPHHKTLALCTPNAVLTFTVPPIWPKCREIFHTLEHIWDMFNKDWAESNFLWLNTSRLRFTDPLENRSKKAMVLYPSIPSNMLCLSFDIFWSCLLCLLCENSIKSDG